MVEEAINGEALLCTKTVRAWPPDLTIGVRLRVDNLQRLESFRIDKDLVRQGKHLD